MIINTMSIKTTVNQNNTNHNNRPEQLNFHVKPWARKIENYDDISATYLIIDEAERLNLAELLLKKGSATQNFLQELNIFMHNPISGALRGFKSHPRVLRNQSIHNRGRWWFPTC